MKLILDAPLTLDPQQATNIDVIATQIDHRAKVLVVTFDLIDADGKHLGRRTITADGAAVQTYVDNQTTTIYNRLMAKLGVSGTLV